MPRWCYLATVEIRDYSDMLCESQQNQNFFRLTQKQITKISLAFNTSQWGRWFGTLPCFCKCLYLLARVNFDHRGRIRPSMSGTTNSGSILQGPGNAGDITAKQVSWICNADGCWLPAIQARRDSHPATASAAVKPLFRSRMRRYAFDACIYIWVIIVHIGVSRAEAEL